MIVHKINVTGTFIRKPKNNTPVGANCYRPKPLEIALQSMKPKTWPIQLFNHYCLIERRQYDAYPLHHIWWQSAPVVVLVKSPQPFMAQTFDISPQLLANNVTCKVTIVNFRVDQHHLIRRSKAATMAA
jgi:hypothetical protein